MYNIINQIAQRSYDSAKNRGKTTSCLGCLKDMGVELKEFYAAVESRRAIQGDLDSVIAEARTKNDKDFVRFYYDTIHNTMEDEMADVVIVGATWIKSAEIAAGDNFNASQSYDVLLATGAVTTFLLRYISTEESAERLRQIINLKLRYNELRND